MHFKYIILFVLLLSGCASQIQQGDHYSNEELFGIYHQSLNLEVDTLYLNFDNKQQKVGTITTVSDIFKPNKAEFSPDKLAAGYFYYRGKNSKENQSFIAIVAHADNSGDSKKNFRLSEQRASVVNDILRLNAPNIPFFYFFGDYLPKYSNHTKKGRELNRRIEVLEFDTEEHMTRYMQLHYRIPYEKEVERRKQARITKINKHKLNKSIKVNDFVNFKGKIYNRKKLGLVAKLGKVKQSSQWSWLPFSKAHAATLVPESCLEDIPLSHVEEQTLSPSDYLPGMNRTAWWGVVNHSGVLVSPIAVAKDDAEPVSTPSIFIYKNYKSKDSEISYQYTTKVKTYEGESYVLYRLYPQTKHISLKCIDLLLPKTAHNKKSKALMGKIFYKYQYGTKVINYLPEMN